MEGNSFLIITGSDSLINQFTDFEVLRKFIRYRLFLNFPDIFFQFEKLLFFLKNIITNSFREQKNIDQYNKKYLVIYKFRYLFMPLIFLYPLLPIFRLIYSSFFLTKFSLQISKVLNKYHQRHLYILRLKK